MVQRDTSWLLGYLCHQINEPHHRCYSECLLWWLPRSFYSKTPKWIPHTQWQDTKRVFGEWCGKMNSETSHHTSLVDTFIFSGTQRRFPGSHLCSVSAFHNIDWIYAMLFTPPTHQSSCTCGLTLDSGHFREIDRMVRFICIFEARSFFRMGDT